MQPKKKVILNVLPQNQRNLGFEFENIKAKYPGFTIAKGKYFPYNMCVQDIYWGCAWRAIQMFLSYYKQTDSFAQLFEKYCSKQQLLSIITKSQLLGSQEIEKIQLAKWAPEEHPNNWAQPLICYLIATDKNIKSQLILINGYPQSAHAPIEVFTKTLLFPDFCKILSTHFQNKGPIMIDDGSLAMTIIGFSHDNQQNVYKILIADPHIKQNKSYLQTGIYQIHLNENGQQLKYVINQIQSQNILYKGYEKMNFYHKRWMVTIGI